MAIYTTNNTPYKGRSLQDMLVPYLMYTLRYDDISNKMGDLGDLSVIWNNLLSPTRDPNTYRMVAEYNERLGDTISDMQNGNINLNDAMNRLLNMRREYNSWSTAVDTAYKQRQKLIEELRALALQPGGFHVTRPAESFSIDELMANPAATYEALSENELYSRGLNAAKAASGRKFSTYEATRFKGEYLTLINQQGYSQKDAAKFLANKYNIPELGQIFDNLSTEYNLNRFGNNESIDRIQLDLAIFNGILDGMTGGRSELNLGRRLTPTFPTIPTLNNSLLNQSNIPLPLSPIIQGYIRGSDVNYNLAMLDENGDVIDRDVIMNRSDLNKIKELIENYLDAIQNGIFTHTLFELDPTGYTKTTTNAIDNLNEDGTLRGSSLGPGAIVWTYNGKRYSIDAYNSLVRKYKELIKPNQSIQDVIDRYGYLLYLPESENPIDAANVVNLGRGLDNSIAQQSITTFPYVLSQSDNNDIITRYNTYLGSENYHESPNVGVYHVDEEGIPSKIYGASDVDFGKNSRLMFMDNILQPDGSRGIEVGFVGPDGGNYIWRGDTQINQFRTKYNNVKKYLLDFTATGIGVGEQEMIQYDSRLGEEDLYRSLNGAKGVLIPGTSYYGFIAYDKYTGNVLKIIFDTPYYIGSGYSIDPYTNQYVLNPGSLIIGLNSMSAQYNRNEEYIRLTLDRFIQDEGRLLSARNLSIQIE